MLARSTLRVHVLVCLTAVVVSACSGSSDKPPAETGDPTAASSGKACAFFTENEVTSLFGTRPQQTTDPYGTGGTTSNCPWMAKAGGEQFLLQVAFFDGLEHYDKSFKSGAKNVASLGDRAFIIKGTLSGVTIEFVRTSKTYFVLFSIAKIASPTRNDANAKADQLLALIKQNLSRL
jgi:hypothetical protein